MTDEIGAKGPAADAWYYARGGRKYGPFSLAQLRQMAISGVLTADDMLLDGASGRWLSAGTAEGVFAAPAAGHPAARAEAAPVPGPEVPSVTLIPETAAHGTGRSDATRSPADLFLACLALASVAVWLLRLGGVWQVAAGLVWVGFGLRAAAMGRVVDFSGGWRRSPWYRPGGAVVALLGVLLAAEGLNARPRVARPVGPAGPRTADRPGRPAAVADGPKPPRAGEPAGQPDASAWAVSQYDRGVAHAKRREYVEAEACLSAAIRAEPSLLHAYFARGDARAGRGDWTAAAADMTEAIRLCALYEADASAADAYRQRGRCRVHLKDFRGAVADYTEALRLRPGDADAYEGRALARRGAGDEDGARADLWEAGRLRRPRD